MNRNEWVEWQNLEITQLVWKLLKNKKEEATENWVAGVFKDQESNLMAIGKVQMLDDLLNIDFEETNGE